MAPERAELPTGPTGRADRDATSIERASAADGPAAARLLRESWRDSYAGLLTRATLATVGATWHAPERLRDEIAAPHVLFLVARHLPDGLVGLATALPIDEESVLLSRLYVWPGRQRRGIGRRLLVAVVDAFPGHQRLRLEVGAANAKGRAFYEREGFVQRGTRRQTIGRERLDLLLMEKRIGGPSPQGESQ